MKGATILILCTALATPAFAETVGEKTGVNSTLGIAPTNVDLVHEAAISDMFEFNQASLPANGQRALQKISQKR